MNWMTSLINKYQEEVTDNRVNLLFWDGDVIDRSLAQTRLDRAAAHGGIMLIGGALVAYAGYLAYKNRKRRRR